jgi:hypothetical protein
MFTIRKFTLNTEHMQESIIYSCTSVHQALRLCDKLRRRHTHAMYFVFDPQGKNTSQFIKVEL